MNEEYINASKRIFWIHEDDWYRIGNTWNTENIKIKWFQIIWKILTDKKFRWLLKETIFYSIRWETAIKGSGSSEVFLFLCNYLQNISKIERE